MALFFFVFIFRSIVRHEIIMSKQEGYELQLCFYSFLFNKTVFMKSEVSVIFFFFFSERARLKTFWTWVKELGLRGQTLLSGCASSFMFSKRSPNRTMLLAKSNTTSLFGSSSVPWPYRQFDTGQSDG